ncbi:dTMP kinase [Chondromyces crocatus]|uniref:Thymidylate kinase n=1 Tax=Chondromyces crocatus TaxID=52 RepID=A0A0K1EAW8_CHOCO|nr:dTMP kinase [Chondromyces crocatus]AKT37713.1 thymidylate kinase [Chondromyces crocatus]
MGIRDSSAPSVRVAGQAPGGKFIVIEGIDGSGTTTQAERYAAHLRSRRRMVHVTREPSGGPIGAQIRQVLTQRLTLPTTNQAQVMALLFAADRLDHVAAEITPLLEDGYVVISDRYDLSSLAYQVTSAQEESEALGGPPSSGTMLRWIRELNRYALRPHLTLVLDVDPEVAAQRRKGRGGARELYDDAELQARLAGAYRRAEELLPGDHVVHIDGNGEPDEIARAIEAVLRPLVGA